MACLLLTFAAADLLVPELCSSEEVVAESGNHPFAVDPQGDDCFCCCSHTERTVIAVVFSEDVPVIVEHVPHERLALGTPRGLYRPPLHS